MPEWKQLESAPVTGQFIVFRSPSGYNGTKYRLQVSRYERERERDATFHNWRGPRDFRAWRTHCGDHLTDDGPEPDAWCFLHELGL